MGAPDTSRARLSAAERYESGLAATVMHRTAERLVDDANVQPGMSVLDVGCGTGVVARAAQRRSGSDEWVMGLDISWEMLTPGPPARTPAGMDPRRRREAPFSSRAVRPGGLTIRIDVLSRSGAGRW